MRAISHLHDFLSELPQDVREEIQQRSIERRVVKAQTVYRQGDSPDELYQLQQGSIKLCNFTKDGKEIVSAEFRKGDWIGEMGIIDGLPRVSYAIALEDSTLRVLSKHHFGELIEKHPVILQKMSMMLCRRLRMAYLMHEESSSLNMHQRLARAIHRLSYSHGQHDENLQLYIAFSQEDLGKMLGVSRQSINKGIKLLVEQQLITLKYGKIFIQDTNALHEQYETLMGAEQIAAFYEQ